MVLDTTPTFGYGPAQDPDELMHNHGIHGVQDLCNLLVRRGKAFHVEAGHWQRSEVLDRIARLAGAARMAARMRGGKVGLIGEPFAGMGDFALSPGRLRAAVGARTVPFPAARLRGLLEAITPEEVAREREADAARFDLAGLDETVHLRSLRTDLAVGRWVREEGLTAFTFNFLDIDRAAGWETVPFLAASKRMAEGIGYAGEGDTLTACLGGAIAAAYPDTSFTEMFCPDWENGAVFLSHMGEVNWRLLDGRPRLREMPYVFSPADNPAFIPGRFRPGRIVLADLAPIRDLAVAGSAPVGDLAPVSDAPPAGGGGPGAGGAAAPLFRLILAPAEMLAVSGRDNMEASVHGWFRPTLPLEEFLAAYSRAGGTHHLALSYAEGTADLEAFGRMMGWETRVLR